MKAIADHLVSSKYDLVFLQVTFKHWISFRIRESTYTLLKWVIVIFIVIQNRFRKYLIKVIKMTWLIEHGLFTPILSSFSESKSLKLKYFLTKQRKPSITGRSFRPLKYLICFELLNNYKVYLLLHSRVGGSGTMVLSKWEILETDSYSFSLHGHLHQVRDVIKSY